MVVASLLVAVYSCTPVRDAGRDSSADSAASAARAAGWLSTRAGQTEVQRVALGTEPFWSVEVRPDSLIFRTPEQPDGIAFARLPGGKPAGVRSGSPARLALEFATDSCSDGMSDRVYPMSATAKLDTTELRGCAEDRTIWLDEGAGFRFGIPPQWERDWYAVVRDRSASPSVPRTVWVDFRLRPTASATPALLVRIARLDRLYWDRMRREPAPGDTLVGAGDAVVAEYGSDVWIAHVPQVSPAAPGTPAAERFARASLDTDRVRRWFTLAVRR